MHYHIYLITNIVNNKKYVGFTSRDPSRRRKEHLSGFGGASLLQKAIKKHGLHSFEFEIVYSSDNFVDTLFKKEEEFIRSFGSHYKDGHGYNMSYGGTSNRRGSKMSVEQRLKLSMIHLNSTRSASTRDAISKSLVGRVLSTTTRQKLHDVNIGKKLTNQTREKMSLASKGKPKSSTHRAALLRSNRRNSYIIIFPDGSTQECDSLTYFASQHGLSQSGLSRCVSGEYKSHKGYTVKKVD